MLFLKQISFSALAALFIFAADVRAETSADVVDMVLASVDGEPLTMSDLRQYIESHGETAPKDLLDGSPEVRKFLRELVIEELINREASSSGIGVSDEEIEAYIDEIKRQNHVDASGFAELLASKGLTIETYQKQVRVDILRTRILGSKVRGKVNILDGDVEKYLEEHPALLPKTGERRVEQIFFAVPAGASDEARANIRERADDVAEDVRGGDSMKESGGEEYIDLGYIDPDDLKPELQEIAKKLQPGETSGVTEISGGYTILRLTEAGEGSKQIDDGVKEQVRRELIEKQFKEAADRYLNDELPKKYHVELKL